MCVVLIPTGKLELLSLPVALTRLFPQAEFVCEPLQRTGDIKPFRSFTSARLPLNSLEDPSSSLSELVGAMTDAIDGEKNDLVVVLDDLELLNVGQEALVVQTFRDAVVRQINRQRSENDRQRLARELQLRASFHLVVPMIESWILADPNGARNAGAALSNLPPQLVPDCDPEEFETGDQSYLNDDGKACTKWISLPEPKRKKAMPEWLKPGLPRARHPKRYMSWICRDSAQYSCTRYDASAGSKAIENLDWPALLSKATHMKWVRALVDDLAHGIGTPPAVNGSVWIGEQAPLTRLREPTLSQGLLRNIA